MSDSFQAADQDPHSALDITQMISSPGEKRPYRGYVEVADDSSAGLIVSIETEHGTEPGPMHF